MTHRPDAAESFSFIQNLLRLGKTEEADLAFRHHAWQERTEGLERAARIVRETPFAEGTHTGTRQLDTKRRAAAGIEALIEPEPKA